MTTNDMRSPTVSVGGIPFTPMTFDQAVAMLLEPARPDAPGVSVRLLNAYCLALASRDPEYREVLHRPSLNLADGTPVHLVMKCIAGSGALERVRGPSLFRETLAHPMQQNARHFLLGGDPATLDELSTRLAKQHPRVDVVGAFSPPFAPLSEAAIEVWSAMIEESGATIVWVGLGTPKQDYVSTRLAELTGLRCVGVGAAFNFLAGSVREAPKWVQRMGIEWLYRLLQEPGRLWKRYTRDNIIFLRLAARDVARTVTARQKVED